MKAIRKNKMTRVFALAIIVLFAIPALPQGRIRFARGRTSTVLKGTVSAGKEVGYSLDARSGQTMSVHLVSRNSHARFELYGLKGTTLAEDANDWQGKLPENNEYEIIISTSDRMTNYTLEVTIR